MCNITRLKKSRDEFESWHRESDFSSCDIIYLIVRKYEKWHNNDSCIILPFFLSLNDEIWLTVRQKLPNTAVAHLQDGKIVIFAVRSSSTNNLRYIRLFDPKLDFERLNTIFRLWINQALQVLRLLWTISLRSLTTIMDQMDRCWPKIENKTFVH